MADHRNELNSEETIGILKAKPNRFVSSGTVYIGLATIIILYFVASNNIKESTSIITYVSLKHKYYAPVQGRIIYYADSIKSTFPGALIANIITDSSDERMLKIKESIKEIEFENQTFFSPRMHKLYKQIEEIEKSNAVFSLSFGILKFPSGTSSRVVKQNELICQVDNSVESVSIAVSNKGDKDCCRIGQEFPIRVYRGDIYNSKCSITKIDSVDKDTTIKTLTLKIKRSDLILNPDTTTLRKIEIIIPEKHFSIMDKFMKGMRAKFSTQNIFRRK